MNVLFIPADEYRILKQAGYPLRNLRSVSFWHWYLYGWLDIQDSLCYNTSIERAFYSS